MTVVWLLVFFVGLVFRPRATLRALFTGPGTSPDWGMTLLVAVNVACVCAAFAAVARWML